MKIKPPIKIQGSKLKLLDFIKSNLPDNISQLKFVEPFAGSGIVSLNMECSNFLLNDINPHIIKLYKDIQSKLIDSQQLEKFLRDESIKLKIYGYDHYLRVRERFNIKPNSYDFIFLSRTGFNGLMRFNKKGMFNVPYGKNDNKLSESYINDIVSNFDKVCSRIQQENWKFLNNEFDYILNNIESTDFVYLDPPYFDLNTTYYNSWYIEHENILIDKLKKLNCKFLMSSWRSLRDKTNPMILTYEKHFNIIDKNHFYQLGPKGSNRMKVVEVLIKNY